MLIFINYLLQTFSYERIIKNKSFKRSYKRELRMYLKNMNLTQKNCQATAIMDDGEKY